MAKIRRKLAALKRHTRARATHVAYDCDWRTFERWCVSAGRPALPATAETLTLYVGWRLDEGIAVSSVERQIAAIAFRHRSAGHTVPSRVEAREYLNSARRDRKKPPRQRAALPAADLRKICGRLVRSTDAKAARDRALLTLGFATGLRRSNLVGLDVADVRFVRGKGVVVAVRSSKTDQVGAGKEIGVFQGRRVATCPVRALQAWLKLRGKAAGPLFTRVRAGDLPTLERLHADTVNQVVKEWVAAIGLDAEDYGAHSLRAGLVTAADNAGTSVLAIMERTGHTSVEMVKRYRRNRDPFAGVDPIAGVL